jgi:hypothetical protein
MTPEERRTAAPSDPDEQPITEEKWKWMKLASLHENT